MFRARRWRRRRPGRDEPAAINEEPPPEVGPDPADPLGQLRELLEEGILTEEEFAAERKKLLGSS